MKKIFITGSADGLGKLAAIKLINEGHQVVLHARNDKRAKEVLADVPQAEAVVIGDLASIEETKAIATQVNQLGKFDAVIHNAGVYLSANRIITKDGLLNVFQINSLAPYILTALIGKPQRLIYLSSGSHYGISPNFKDVNWQQRSWQAAVAYGESKLYVVMLAFAVARLWPNVYSNALDPGWVPTKMGGPNAPDDLDKGFETQVWLATSDEPQALVSGKFFYHKRIKAPNSFANEVELQDQFLKICEELSGVKIGG